MRKTYLSPSILSADFAHLGEDIRCVKEGGATYLHYDVMDGRFEIGRASCRERV